MKQTKLFKDIEKAYGGSLLKKRKGRKGPRPLATRQSMHLVLRSSLAKDEWSFIAHRAKITQIVNRFAARYGVRVLSIANVGNHLHLHIQLGNRFTYAPFIRAVTGSIAMAITKVSRWSKGKIKIKFRDRRPFTRVIVGWRAFLSVQDYIRVNKIESQGFDRVHARLVVQELWRRSTA